MRNNFPLEMKEVEIEKIYPDQNQPRKDFALESLAKAIQKNGVVPIEVISEGNKFKIIDGERRYRACKKLNLKTIPCILIDKINKNKILERQLVLDFHKKHFSPVEKAKALKKLKELKNCSNRELSSELNISHTTVNNLISLLEAPEVLQDAVKQGVDYKLILKLKDLPLKDQLKIARELLKGTKFIKARIRKYGLSSQKWRKNKESLKILNSKGIFLNEGVFCHNKNESVKHFLVKSLIFKILKEKGRMVGTEVETSNSIADVLDATNFFVYEIETKATPENRKEILYQYKDVDVVKDIFIIDLREVPDNIMEMERYLRERII